MGGPYIGESYSSYDSADDPSDSSSSSSSDGSCKAFPLVSDEKQNTSDSDDESVIVDDVGGYDLDPKVLDDLDFSKKPGLDDHPYFLYVLGSNDFKRYARSVKRSGGYDVVGYDAMYWTGSVVPIDDIFQDTEFHDCVAKLAEKAIRCYNVLHGKAYEFDRLLKVTKRTVQGAIFYITFLAKNASHGDVGPSQSETFRARVYDRIGKRPVVEYCDRFEP